MNIEPDEIVDGINGEFERPTFDSGATARSMEYTRYLNELHQVSQISYGFERHAGFGRRYPGSPMIDDDFRLTMAEREALEHMKARKPFKVSNEEFLDIVQELYINLADAQNHNAPAVFHDGLWEHPKNSSYYTPHIVVLTGKKSLITVLHEYTHSLGFGEVAATWWSTNVFKLLYPKSFDKLKHSKVNPHFLRKNLEDKYVADEEFCKRKAIGEFKDFADKVNEEYKSWEEEEQEELEELATKEE